MPDAIPIIIEAARKDAKAIIDEFIKAYREDPGLDEERSAGRLALFAETVKSRLWELIRIHHEAKTFGRVAPPYPGMTADCLASPTTLALKH